VSADKLRALEQGGAWRNPFHLEHRVAYDTAAPEIHGVVQPCGPQATTTPVVVVTCGGGNRTTEVRLVSTVTLDTLALLRLDAALRLHGTARLPFDTFLGAGFLSVAAGSDEGDRCGIAVLAQQPPPPNKAHRVTSPEGSVGGGGGSGSGGGSSRNGRVLLLWQPVVKPASFIADERHRPSDTDALTDLGPLPFNTPHTNARARGGASTAGLTTRLCAASSNDGSLRAAGDLVCRTASCAPESLFRWRHGALFTVDGDDQLWATAVDPSSTFPGPLYPAGFHLLTKIEHYIEREDELDIDPAAAASSAASSSSSSSSSSLDVVTRPAAIDVGYPGEHPIKKLPFSVLVLSQPDDGTTDDDGKSKRKRGNGDGDGDGDGDGTDDQLTLVDILPLPRRICTGDFTARLVRERAAGAVALAVCMTPAAVAQRVAEFAEEAADNVRKGEIRKYRSRRTNKAKRQAAAEDAAQAEALAAAHAAAQAVAATEAAAAEETAAAATDVAEAQDVHMSVDADT
jgi:hypothetical protein